MKRLVFIALACISQVSFGQHGWTLQECINYALEHNISLKQASLNNEVNKNNETQSKAALLPSVNGGISHIYNYGQTIDRYTNTFASSRVLSQNFYVQASLVLWSGLSQYNNIKANEYNYLSGVENLNQQKYDLSLRIADAYIGVIFSEEILKKTQNQFEITKEQLERTQKLVTAGSLAKSEEYDLLAQLANEELNVTTADNNHSLSILTLKQLMNLDTVANFHVARPEIQLDERPLLEPNISNIYETSLKMQPSIKSGEYSILSAQYSLSAARGKRSPILAFNASTGTGTSGLAEDVLGMRYVGYQTVGITSKGDSVYTPITEPITEKTSRYDQFRRNVNQTVGFQLTVPLYNGLQNHTAVKNAKLNALNVKLSQDLVKQNLYKNITQAAANAKAALNKYNASMASVAAAEKSFAFAQQKFEAGSISAYEFNSSKTKLYAAEANLVQAKYDYVFKLKVLDYYQGKPLGF